MPTLRVIVLGGGPAGLAAAIHLADQGHAVALIERDAIAVQSAEAAFESPRAGIAHFQQPHAFIPRGLHELREHFPTAYESMIEAGASVIDVSRKVPGGAGPGDEALQYLAVRRPVIEWALHRTAMKHSGIKVIAGAIVQGVTLQGSRVTSVRVDGQDHAAEVIIDAMGRRTPMREWLAAGDAPAAAPEKSDCGVIYYSRYYRVREGQSLPDGPWTLGPRGDLGYMGFSTFPGDNRTFACVFAAPTGVSALKALQHERAFEAAVASIPALAAWANAELCEPVTGVLAMGGLQNTFALPASGRGSNVFPVADAFGHTDPVLAHGLSFALIHAVAAGTAIRAHADVADARAAYIAAQSPLLRERFDFASALDAQRLRMWRGEAVDFARRTGDYALFSLVAGTAVAAQDARVFRVILRRLGLLDSTSVLDDDVELQAHIEARFAAIRRMPRPPQGPARDEMLAMLAAATAAA